MKKERLRIVKNHSPRSTRSKCWGWRLSLSLLGVEAQHTLSISLDSPSDWRGAPRRQILAPMLSTQGPQERAEVPKTLKDKKQSNKLAKHGVEGKSSP